MHASRFQNLKLLRVAQRIILREMYVFLLVFPTVQRAKTPVGLVLSG